MIKTFLILLILVLPGCQTANWELPDGPAAYREGYHDGCDSGRFSARNLAYTYTKDAPRAESDKEYEAGWQLGYDRCKEAQQG